MEEPQVRHRYLVYNLSIDSDFELPELMTEPSTEQHGAVVRIRRGQIDRDCLGDLQSLGPSIQVGVRRLFFEVKTVATYFVEEGDSITIEPAPQSDAATVRLFLLGTALGALMMQRGFLVLHGNAIRIGDSCMVCVGQSGAGKSTLAAGFMKRGYDVLADDVVPVDAAGQALPGLPRVKLWQDAANHIRIDTSALRRIRPNVDKFHLPLPKAVVCDPVPIRWMYVLKNNVVDDVKIADINGLQRFIMLKENTYRSEILGGMNLLQDYLKLCANLCNNLRMAEVTRPSAGFHLEEMVDRLIDDMRRRP